MEIHNIDPNGFEPTCALVYCCRIWSVHKSIFTFKMAAWFVKTSPSAHPITYNAFNKASCSGANFTVLVCSILYWYQSTTILNENWMGGWQKSDVDESSSSFKWDISFYSIHRCSSNFQRSPEQFDPFSASSHRLISKHRLAHVFRLLKVCQTKLLSHVIMSNIVMNGSCCTQDSYNNWRRLFRIFSLIIQNIQKLHIRVFWLFCVFQTSSV